MGPLVLPILNIVGGLLDKIIPDKAAAEAAKLELLATAQTQEFQLALEQIKTNAEEAKHESIFVAGWRPAVGWVCASALFYQFLGYPLSNWFIEIWQPDFLAPVLETDSLMELTLAMLGMAGLRSWEKYKGLTK